MTCLDFAIAPARQASLLIAVTAASLSVETAAMAQVDVTPAAQASASVVPAPDTKITVAPNPQVRLSIGEVCTISRGTLVVLAASDGPLRTRDGGFFLLNPAIN